MRVAPPRRSQLGAEFGAGNVLGRHASDRLCLFFFWADGSFPVMMVAMIPMAAHPLLPALSRLAFAMLTLRTARVFWYHSDCTLSHRSYHI